MTITNTMIIKTTAPTTDPIIIGVFLLTALALEQPERQTFEVLSQIAGHPVWAGLKDILLVKG